MIFFLGILNVENKDKIEIYNNKYI